MRFFRAGLTLVEAIAVLLVVLIVAFLISGVVAKLPGAGDRTACTANLRNLHIALQNYMQDKGHWPQEPNYNISKPAELEKFEEWWIEELKPYGMVEAGWLCPGIKRLGKLKQQGRQPRMHYLPTKFDGKPNTPMKWPNMPWAIEIANVHGHGPLLILPDGAVKDHDLFLYEISKGN